MKITAAKTALDEVAPKYAKHIHAEAILFEDDFQTDLNIPFAIFRKEKDEYEI